MEIEPRRTNPKLLSPFYRFHDGKMPQYIVGDTVCWMRAAEWKLKDPTGTIKRIFPQNKDGSIDYEIQFVFGMIRLNEKQFEPHKAIGTTV